MGGLDQPIITDFGFKKASTQDFALENNMINANTTSSDQSDNGGENSSQPGFTSSKLILKQRSSLSPEKQSSHTDLKHLEDVLALISNSQQARDYFL